MCVHAHVIVLMSNINKCHTLTTTNDQKTSTPGDMLQPA